MLLHKAHRSLFSVNRPFFSSLQHLSFKTLSHPVHEVAHIAYSFDTVILFNQWYSLGGGGGGTDHNLCLEQILTSGRGKKELIIILY